MSETPTPRNRNKIAASLSVFAVSAFALAGVLVSSQPLPATSVNNNDQQVLEVTKKSTDLTPGYILPQLADYVVSVDGDDSNTGTFSLPLQTIQAAVDKAEAGDTIVVLAGSYGDSVVFNKSGAAGNPITIQAEQPGEVYISGLNTQIISNGKEWISIKGLYFSDIQVNNKKGFVIEAANNWTLQDLTFVGLYNPFAFYDNMSITNVAL